MAQFKLQNCIIYDYSDIDNFLFLLFAKHKHECIKVCVLARVRQAMSEKEKTI